MRLFGLVLVSFALSALNCVADERGDLASFVDQLKSEKAGERAAAAEALENLGKAAAPATPALVEALSDGRIAEQFPFGVPAPRRNVAAFASEALSAIGAPAVPALIQELDNRDESVRRRVVQTFERIGRPADQALPRLKELAAREPSYELRYAAIESYATISPKNEELVAILTKALADPSPQVRGLAARKLGETGRQALSAAPTLLRLLDDRERRWHALATDAVTERAVRFDAAEALGKIGASQRESIAALNRLRTGDEDPDVRVAAALALLRINPDDKAAMETLIAALANDEQGTAGPQEAARSLESLGPKAAPALGALTESLSHDYEFVRMAAARAIGAIGGRRAVATLVPALSDDHAQVREAAATALGELGTIAAPAVLKLVELLGDKRDTLSFFVRQAAAEALGAIGPAARSALPQLRQIAMSESDETLRQKAAEAVKRISQDK